jgi:hypothetical protein
MENLPERMKAAGMFSIEQMLNPTPMDRLHAHAGVTDLKSFEEWLQMRRKEFITMQARMTLDGDDKIEMFEWVLAHNAVLSEVMANFRQATNKT